MENLIVMDEFIMPAKVGGVRSRGSKYYPMQLHSTLQGLKLGQGIVVPDLKINDSDGSAIALPKQLQPITWRIANAFKGTGKKFSTALMPDGTGIGVKLIAVPAETAPLVEVPAVVVEQLEVLEAEVPALA